MTTLYKKKGRRYYPAAETEVFDGVPEGWWLMRVQPGLRSMRRTLDPAYAETEAALREAEDAMVDAMRVRCEPTGPQTKHVPEKDRAKYMKAWEAWKAIVGDVPMYFEGVSMMDVVEAGLNAVRKKIVDSRKTEGGSEHE